MKFGSRLKELIKSANFSQADLADKIGVSRSTISFWVNSEYPPLDAIETVCKELDIPLYEFFMTEEQIKKTMPDDIDPIQIELIRTLNNLPDDKHIAILEAFCKIAETFVK